MWVTKILVRPLWRPPPLVIFLPISLRWLPLILLVLPLVVLLVRLLIIFLVWPLVVLLVRLLVVFLFLLGRLGVPQRILIDLVLPLINIRI